MVMGYMYAPLMTTGKGESCKWLNIKVVDSDLKIYAFWIIAQVLYFILLHSIFDNPVIKYSSAFVYPSMLIMLSLLLCDTD